MCTTCVRTVRLRHSRGFFFHARGVYRFFFSFRPRPRGISGGRAFKLIYNSNNDQKVPQSHDHTTQQQQWAAVHTRIPHAPSVAMRVFRPLTAPPIRQLCFSVFRFSTTVIIYYIHKLELSAGPVRVFRCRVLGTVGKYENTSRGHRSHGS